jgi:hypothetical protein
MSTTGSVRLSLRAPTPTLVGRERSPAAVYTTVPAAHGTARAAPVGGSGADGGEYNGPGMMFDRLNVMYVAEARRAEARVGRGD